MTRLRVLTGLHAGVFLDWIQSPLEVGAGEELDVYISDWNVQRIELQRDAHGRCHASWAADDGAAPVDGERREDGRIVCPLEPWVPVRFGAIILCIGPADQAWPDDAELLQRCFAPAPAAAPAAEPVRAGPRKRRGRLGVTAAVAMLAVFATTAGVQRDEPRDKHADAAAAPDAAAGPASAASLPALSVSAAASAAASAVPASSALAASAVATVDPVRRLRQAIDAQALQGLELEAAGDRVIVRGILATRTAVDQLNHRLDGLPPSLAVSRRFAALPAIIDRLYESLPGSGLRVTQVGPTRFEVSGEVDDPQRAQQVIAQLDADLDELGLEVFGTPQRRGSGLPAMTGMLVDSQGTSYLRTRDGAKHIVPAAGPAPGRRRPANVPPPSNPLAPVGAGDLP